MQWIYVDKTVDYPSGDDFYHPSEAYPEYIFGSSFISKKENAVYRSVRNLFMCMKLDFQNCGTEKWNPLGAYISPGNTVLIKPNMVSHANGNKRCGMECIVTHPSIVRVLLDYTIKALCNSGKVMIADAPVQGADYQLILRNAGYERIIEFYRTQGVEISFVDLRAYQSNLKNGVIVSKKQSQEKEIIVSMGQTSAFSKYAATCDQFNIMDYSEAQTKSYHHENKHDYSINELVLSADVIINLPKPKTHKIAGMTGAQKNLIGTIFDKACLPHHTIGPQCYGGDEYKERSLIKSWLHFMREKRIECENNQNVFGAFLWKYTETIGRKTAKMIFSDKIMLGSWYGNNTIWKSTLDVCKIIQYADKAGIIQDTQQRRIFTLCDMIICGEREGPLSPSAKYAGYLIAGDDPAIIDRIICTVMGFNYILVPSVRMGYSESKSDREVTIINENMMRIEKINDEWQWPEPLHCIPQSGWKNLA